MITALIIVSLFTGLAFWKNDRMLYYLAALSLAVFGFAYYTTISYYSILVVILGVYCFARGVWAT